MPQHTAPISPARFADRDINAKGLYDFLFSFLIWTQHSDRFTRLPDNRRDMACSSSEISPDGFGVRTGSALQTPALGRSHQIENLSMLYAVREGVLEPFCLYETGTYQSPPLICVYRLSPSSDIHKFKDSVQHAAPPSPPVSKPNLEHWEIINSSSRSRYRASAGTTQHTSLEPYLSALSDVQGCILPTSWSTWCKRLSWYHGSEGR